MKKIRNPKKAELVKDVMHGPPHIHVGKNGINEQVILEIKTQLKRNKIIKIKFQKSIIEERDIKELIEEITKQTRSSLVDLRGHNIIISKN
ncbi:MAG: YhbY family RNA-binding protein [Candidatus Lokiarchaeota archaeon]|nr:YhbY family RNA-binding protein [Candidatus Lokiarchaeota archaeon]